MAVTSLSSLKRSPVGLIPEYLWFNSEKAAGAADGGTLRPEGEPADKRELTSSSFPERVCFSLVLIPEAVASAGSEGP